MKILVRNLARDITQPELLALFEAHGRVQSCTIVMDEATGGSKGFGFANMPVIHEAKAAIRALNGLERNGSKMRVKKAEVTAKDESLDSAADTQPQDAVADSNKADEHAQAKSARLKKDGTRLGPKKARSFKKKPSR